MNNFETILKNNTNEYSNLYLDLPEDLQYTIYTILKNDLDKERYKINKHRVLKQIKRDICHLNMTDYGGHSGGAWELLFHKRNLWSNSYINPDVNNLLNESLTVSATQFCRNEFLFNP